VVELREYLDVAGRSPFSVWFGRLNAPAAAKITVALTRLSHGHRSNIKPLGAGVSEYKVDFGPGYRIYLGWDGERLVILLAGGTKKRQQVDIAEAQARWVDYRKRKKGN